MEKNGVFGEPEAQQTGQTIAGISSNLVSRCETWRNVVQAAKERMKNCSIPSRPWSLAGVDLLRGYTTRSQRFEPAVSYTVSIYTPLEMQMPSGGTAIAQCKFSSCYFVFMLHVMNLSSQLRNLTQG